MKGHDIDLVLTDPPYGTTQCKWDSVLPLPEMWEGIKGCIKNNAAIVLFSAQPFTSVLVSSNIKDYKYSWVWEKTQATGFLNAKKQPMRAHEDICVFYDKQSTFNPQKTENHKPMNSYTKLASVQNKTEVYGKVKMDQSGGGATSRFPRSVLLFSSDKQRTKLNGTIHPTQKPVALLEYLIKTYTNEGDTVLDFTMGSGSTGVACMNTNRKFIGIEKDQKYFEIAKKRIEEANK